MTKTILTHKIHIKPNKTVIKLLDNYFGYSRHIYNRGLSLWKDEYIKGNKPNGRKIRDIIKNNPLEWYSLSPHRQQAATFYSALPSCSASYGMLLPHVHSAAEWFLTGFVCSFFRFLSYNLIQPFHSYLPKRFPIRFIVALIRIFYHHNA
jgi:hypothetical protein